MKSSGKTKKHQTLSVREKKLLHEFSQRGIIRSRDLDKLGYARQELFRLKEKGLIQQFARGLYGPSGYEPSEQHSLIEACERVPRGVICLLTALRFHGLTTQRPFEVWVAIGIKDWAPRNNDGTALRVLRFSPEALSAGVQTHRVDSKTIRVFHPAKTVADCFKYRNKIGIDVALEALRDCWRKKQCNMDELWHYAKICRVSRVMYPYLESLV